MLSAEVVCILGSGGIQKGYLYGTSTLRKSFVGSSALKQSFARLISKQFVAWVQGEYLGCLGGGNSIHGKVE
jgi:hypothetical protein